MRILPRHVFGIAFVACLPLTPAAAQVRFEGEPVALSHPLAADVPTFFLAPPDVDALQAEDQFNEANGIPGPLRYGMPLSTHVDLLADGALEAVGDLLV